MRRRRGMAAFVVACVALVSSGGARAATARVTLDDFKKLHARKQVLAIDVRSEEVFTSGHIPGAINVPLADIERRSDEIRSTAAKRLVVTYCSCPDEHASAAAVALLAKAGVKNAKALVGGYPAWLSAGGQVER